jgi:coenzyme F420-reducing hydrogenase gamma subunit
MVWIELMNQNYFKWKDLIEIRHARVLRRVNELKDIDVAFVEGAITTESDADKLREIRDNSKRLIAIGSCAINGMPAAQRNNFNEELKKEIAFLIERFNQTEKVRTVRDIVKIDDEVLGCPMEEDVFMKILEKYLNEFGVINAVSH